MENQPKFEKTLLWEAFSTLEKQELRALSKFVRSPFFNQKQQITGLFDYLKTCREEQKTPSPEKAFQNAYPENPLFDDQKLRLANSDLLRLIEHFWVYQEKFRDEGRAKIRLAAAYRKRKLGKHFNIALREARADREAQPFRHAEYFHDQNLIEWEQYQFSTSERRSGDFNLQQLSDVMDKAFIVRKLRHVCFSLSHQAVFKTEYDFGLLEAVLRHVEKQGLAETAAAIGLYFHGLKFLSSPENSEQHFSKFRAMLAAHAEVFPGEELRSLYLLAINFGVKKINEAAEPYFRETLELYRGALDRDLLFENGQISRFAFNNIVAIALRVGEADWAEVFIQKYRPHLERHFREATFSLNLARIAYSKKDYRTALQNLQRADYKDLINNLNAKTLQLKIYYETDEFDLLESHLTSMKNFIRRQAGIGYHQTNYLNIVKFTRLLMKFGSPSPEELENLRARVLAEPVLTEREWLLEMLTK